MSIFILTRYSQPLPAAPNLSSLAPACAPRARTHTHTHRKSTHRKSTLAKQHEAASSETWCTIPSQPRFFSWLISWITLDCSSIRVQVAHFPPEIHRKLIPCDLIILSDACNRAPKVTFPSRLLDCAALIGGPAVFIPLFTQCSSWGHSARETEQRRLNFPSFFRLSREHHHLLLLLLPCVLFPSSPPRQMQIKKLVWGGWIQGKGVPSCELNHRFQNHFLSPGTMGSY